MMQVVNIPPSGEVPLLKTTQGSEMSAGKKTKEKNLLIFHFEVSIERELIEDIVDVANGDTS